MASAFVLRAIPQGRPSRARVNLPSVLRCDADYFHTSRLTRRAHPWAYPGLGQRDSARPVPLYHPDPIAHAVELVRCGVPALDVAEALHQRGVLDRLAVTAFARSDARWPALVRLRIAVQRMTIGRIEAIRIARSLHPA